MEATKKILEKYFKLKKNSNVIFILFTKNDKSFKRLVEKLGFERSKNFTESVFFELMQCNNKKLKNFNVNNHFPEDELDSETLDYFEAPPNNFQGNLSFIEIELIKKFNFTTFNNVLKKEKTLKNFDASINSKFNQPKPIPLGNLKDQKEMEDLIKSKQKELETSDYHPDAQSENTGPQFEGDKNPVTGEIGGPQGLEPTRYGDWERKGR
ncbi:hypothetical protein HDU92_000263, partial [Lobulomyces angularis]